MYGESEEVTQFLRMLAMEGRPLAAAAIILLLAQILHRLEQLHTAPLISAPQNHRSPHRVPVQQNRQSPVPHKAPKRFFPIPDTETAVREPNPEAAVAETAAKKPEKTDDKLQFFKLH